RLVAVGGDRPLHCLQNGGAGRHTDNLFKFIATENVKKALGDENDQFLLQTVPLILSSTLETCDYAADILNNSDVLFETAKAGFGDGIHGLHAVLTSGNRFFELVQALKSTYSN